MRLTSEMFVAALMRQAEIVGCFATIAKRGSASAGAIFIVSFDTSTKLSSLYAPAPQMLEGNIGDRFFEKRLTDAYEGEISETLAKEQRFDTDLYVVDISGPANKIVSLLEPFCLPD